MLHAVALANKEKKLQQKFTEKQHYFVREEQTLNILIFKLNLFCHLPIYVSIKVKKAIYLYMCLKGQHHEKSFNKDHGQ